MPKFVKHAVAVCAACGLWMSSIWAAGPVAAKTAGRAAPSTLVPYQAALVVRRMLLANGSVNAQRPASLHAALAYEVTPATRTQTLIDSYNLKHQVQAKVIGISVDRHAIWLSANADIVRARMVFREYLGSTKTKLARIVWNYDYIVTKHGRTAWKVADVLTDAPAHVLSRGSRFDVAPNIAVHSLSASFLQGLNRYQNGAKYPSGKVRLDAFGYFVDKPHNEVRLYLFVHNDTKRPVFHLTGTLLAKDNGTTMFTAPLHLGASTFGVLMPGKTRFCVVHIPASDVQSMTLTQTYPGHAQFSSSISFESV